MYLQRYTLSFFSFMIDFLVMSQSHVISLNISQCFESGEPCSDVVEVLKGDKFPSEDCSVDKNYKDGGKMNKYLRNGTDHTFKYALMK